MAMVCQAAYFMGLGARAGCTLRQTARCCDVGRFGWPRYLLCAGGLFQGSAL